MCPPSVKPAPYAGQSEWKSASGPDRISGSVRNGPVNPIKFFGPDNGSGRFHLFGTGVKDTDRPVRDRQPPDRVPEEMLEPDMDIESDLGVDSIKK